MTSRPRTIAILPAAGAATRLDGAMKEMLPVVFRPAAGGLVPVPALLHSLQTVAEAGISRAIVVVAPSKLELVRLLMDGAESGVELCWVIQPEPAGLTEAIVRGLGWAGGSRAVLVLPDTLFAPTSALTDVAGHTADLALAVFPVDRPELLGPVVHDHGLVRQVLDKPSGPCPANSWGLIGMSPRFQRWLSTRVAADPALGRVPVGLHINDAIAAGLSTIALPYDGWFRDLGTPRGLADWVLDP